MKAAQKKSPLPASCFPSKTREGCRVPAAFLGKGKKMKLFYFICTCVLVNDIQQMVCHVT